MTADNENPDVPGVAESPDLGARVLALEAQVRELQALIHAGVRPAPQPAAPAVRGPAGAQPGLGHANPSVPPPAVGVAPPGFQAPPPGYPQFQPPPTGNAPQPASASPSYVPGGHHPQPPAGQAWPAPGYEPPQRLTTEDVVSRLGIGLLILGCGYLFKYSVEHGWIGPAARVAIGGLVGLLLLVAGVVLHGKRQKYAAVLMGGSIAAFHVTLFGAHRLYSLVDSGPAVGLVFLVNLLALGLAVRFGHLALSVIGALGAFGVPFMLDGGGGGGTFLTIYIAAIVAVNGAIALWKHWQPLLLVAFTGFWLGLAILSDSAAGIPDNAVVALALLAWPFLGWSSMFLHKERRQVAAIINIFHPPILALVLSGVADWSDESIGAVMLAGAAVPVALGVVRRVWGPAVGFAVHALAFTACGIVAGALLLPDEWVVLGLAVIPLALAAGFKLSGDDELEATAVAEAGLLSIGFGMVMFAQIDSDDFAVLANALTFFVLLAVPALTTAEKRGPILLFGHGLGMLWCFGALEPLGAGIVSAAWAAIAIAELLAGTITNRESVRNLGVATILIVSGKLVFFDTSNVPQVWRVLLFMGIGAAFLGVGWVLPKLTGGDSPETESESPTP